MQKPPFKLNAKILNHIADIQEMLGQVRGYTLDTKVSPKLRKENKIKTVHHSLAIEGNSISESQVTALLENKRVLGPQKQILEVMNAIGLYDIVAKLKTFNENDFLKAHKTLMHGLIENPGKYRSNAVGVLKGSKVSHMAPPAKQVPKLMGHLFNFLKNDPETHLLIKACVFHYELEFIHPFMDGNGRMGRLWQQRILMEHSPVFEFLAVETWIHKEQKNYYSVLEKCDRLGDSTDFIEFSLGLILKELRLFSLEFRPIKISPIDRITDAVKFFGAKSLTRKDYQKLHKNISAPTASRDLALAVEKNIFTVEGTQATAIYKVK